MVHLYGFYTDRVLAVTGGVLDQPNVYMDAMSVIAAVYQEYIDVEQANRGQ